MTKIEVGPAPVHPGGPLLVLVDETLRVLALALVLAVAVLDELGTTPSPSSNPTRSPVRLPQATTPHGQTISASAIRADRRMRQAR
jgi:hypothetical protein